jgi:hypothetical protein
VYVISLDKEFNGELKVTQPEEKFDLEARVEALEKKLYAHLESEKAGRNNP